MTPAEHMVNRMRSRKEIVETEKKAIQTGVEHVAAGKGSKSLCVFGEMVMCKITSYQTGGAYSLFEVETPPGSGVPPHVQHREDEAFYILEGEYEFLVENRTISAGAGSLVYVPKGNLHTHKSVGEESGRMLVSQTPGGLHERFFKEVGERATAEACPVSQGAADIGKIAAIATEYGIEMPLTSDQ